MKAIASRFLFLASAFVMTGCHFIDIGPQIQGSRTAKKESRTVSNFSSIEFHGTGKLMLKQSGNESCNVEMDDNFLEHFETIVTDGTLHIGLKNGNFKVVTPIIVTVEAKSVTKLQISGATAVEATDLKSDSLTVNISGASRMTLKGSIKKQDINLSGASHFTADEVDCESAEVDCSGASHASVNAKSSLSVNASGASHVEYGGSAEVTKNTSGASSVRKRK